MAEKARVLIADDHSVVAEGISNFLSRADDFEVVGTVTAGRQAIAKIKSLAPDIVILDISMPDIDGIEATYEIKSFDQQVRILIFTMSVSKAHATALFTAGVGGYVLKSEPLDELLLALRALKTGGTFYSRSVQKILQEHMKELELGEAKNVAGVQNGIAKLSVREKEVFALLADGLTVKETAHRLSISPKTVETHKYNIMDKLQLNSIAEFTKIALKKNLISL